eukprot:13225043-Alexandrium_andersonii.AAC.1
MSPRTVARWTAPRRGAALAPGPRAAPDRASGGSGPRPSAGSGPVRRAPWVKLDVGPGPEPEGLSAG